MKKNFINILKELCISRHIWQVWEEVITMIALSINITDWNSQKKVQRKKQYQYCFKKMDKENRLQKIEELLNIIVDALEENPEQDFLGEIYMELKLGNHWKGQFFTPYHVSQAIARLNINSIQSEINKKDFFSVCDPACGAGVLLLAFANELKKQGINFQQKTLFVAQDIDKIAAMMCYIQISLLGCAGYIVIGNTLENPLNGDLLLHPVEKENLEIWYTPMFFSSIWQIRKMIERRKTCIL